MTLWDILDVIGTVLFTLSSLAILLFLIMYSIRSRPWADPDNKPGKAVFWFILVLASIMVLATLFEFVPAPEHVIDVLEVFFYGLLLAVLVGLNIVLIDSQRQSRRKKERGKR